MGHLSLAAVKLVISLDSGRSFVRSFVRTWGLQVVDAEVPRYCPHHKYRQRLVGFDIEKAWPSHIRNISFVDIKLKSKTSVLMFLPGRIKPAEIDCLKGYDVQVQ